jgi:hypothetical protein
MVGKFEFRTMHRGGNYHPPSVAWQYPFIWNKDPAWCITCNYLLSQNTTGWSRTTSITVNRRKRKLIAKRGLKQLELIADRLLRRQSLYNCATAGKNITPITTLKQADLLSEVFYSPAFLMRQHKYNSWYTSVIAICFNTRFLSL